MFSRLINWFRNLWAEPDRRPTIIEQLRPPVPTPSPVGSYRISRDLKPMTVLAEGEVFHFYVYPTAEWCGEGVTHEQLSAIVNSQEKPVREEVKQTIRSFARSTPPHRPRDLELILNDHFGRTAALDTGVLVRREVKVRVRPEERVKEKLLPYQERRIELDTEHDLHLHRASLVNELTERWSQVLSELHRKPFTVAGAKLVEQEFAKIMEGVRQEEVDLRRELLGVLEKAGQSHSELGLYEYAETYDRLIKEYQQGIDLLAGPDAGRTDSGRGNGRPG